MVGMPRAGKFISNVTNGANVLMGNAKAQLVPEEGFNVPVIFSFNPSSVQLSKTNRVEGPRGVLAHGIQDAVRATGNIKLTLNDAHLTGFGSVILAVKSLLKWATPIEIDKNGNPLANPLSAVRDTVRQVADIRPTSGGSPLGGGNFSFTKKGGGTGAKDPPKLFGLPVLLFSWGLYGPRGANIPVTLERVTVKYQRWDPMGVPIWAKVDLSLVEVHREFPLSNPTSGGVTGRSMHTVQQGENVVQIANVAYGSPKAWRQVAEANKLDDPLRVKPGRALTLPPREEL